MKHLTRSSCAATAAILVLGLGAGPAHPAPTDPAAPGPTGAPAVGGGGTTTTVTLVTGDKVAVGGDPAGARSVTVLPTDGAAPTPYLSREANGDRYVIPLSAVPALAAERLDPELFNVTGLIRQGYDDARTGTLPLIAEYAPATVTARSAPAVPAGTRRTAILSSIHSVALHADKATAARLWTDLGALSGTARSGSAVRRVWLDRKVTATLDRSTAQIGAPAAWAAGYDGSGVRVAVLDTGVDAGHPDLAGKVVGSGNFTYADDHDGNGHGTHTASTVAGTGAAGDGAKRGVAPGAELLIGKVLDDTGGGASSWIIAGMEWAAAQGADVISMSLGGQDLGGCADPMALAAERLAKDTMFVVSAGNSGPGKHTVGTPGCTPGVLTVGAVDRADATAPFSSRGFIPQTHALKPEIAAPGVGISAAASGGRGAQAYRTMSGTSMAAPHVAGAAAILLQAHPDWTPQQVEAALVSAAALTAGGVAEVGGGRVDVAAALTAPVTGPGVVDAGSYPWPQAAGTRADVQATYTNTSDQPVTLALTVQDVRGNDGRPAPAGLLTLDSPTVTVPARGTATVPLTVHPGTTLPLAQYGDLGGRVVATAPDGRTVSTPFSLYVEPKSVDVTLQVIGRDGETPDTATVDIASTDTGEAQWAYLGGVATKTLRLRAGQVFIGAYLNEYDAGSTSRTGMVDEVTFLAYPELEVTEDTTVVLDARKAKEVEVTGDRPLTDHSSYLGFGRWTDEWMISAGIIDPGHINRHYAWSSGTPEQGEFDFHTLWRLGAPRLALSTGDGAAIPAMYTTSVYAINNRGLFDGNGHAGLADAGTGTPAELAAADVRGKLVLVENETTWKAAEIAANAAAAGATGVLVHRATPGRWSTGSSNVLPMVTIEASTVAGLRTRLAAGPVTLQWKAQAYSPYLYNLLYEERDAVPADPRYVVDVDELARVDATWHAVGSVPQTTDWLNYLAPWNPDDYLALGLPIRVPMPGTRVEYYTPAAGQWRHSTDSRPSLGFPMNGIHTYRKGQRLEESWFGGILRPAAGRVYETGEQLTVGARDGNVMAFDFRHGYWADGDASHWSPDMLAKGELEVSRDGESYGVAGALAATFEVPAGAGDYEVRLANTPYDEPNPDWTRSTAVDTRFRFASQAGGLQVLPLMFPGYEVDLDAANTLRARRQTIGLSVSGHAGYTPGRITAATLAYSYDGGRTWTEAEVQRRKDRWTAELDHLRAAGKSVTLRVGLTGSDGASVTQTVHDAYTVR